MNKHLLCIALLAIILPGCSKFIYAPEDQLEGQWRLHRAERSGFLNRRIIDTDYNNGVFTFNGDGTAEYRDGSIFMNGNWNMRKRRNRSYRDNGDVNDKTRISFSLNLYNFAANRVLNLDFDDCYFNGRNRFTAEYETATYRYRYEFRR